MNLDDNLNVEDSVVEKSGEDKRNFCETVQGLFVDEVALNF